MSDARSDDEHGDFTESHELVMPFLPVKSRGGPFDDDAFVCGYEMGRFDALMQEYEDSPLTMRHDPDLQTFHEENSAQADLIAMRHGFVAKVSPPRDGWVQVALNRAKSDA